MTSKCNHHRCMVRCLSKFCAPSVYRISSINRFLLQLIFLLLSAAIPRAASQLNRNSPPESPYELDANFNPTMTVIIVVLVCTFFFIGFFSIYVRQCAESNARLTALSAAAAAAANGFLKPSARGLDPAVIESFPVFPYCSVKEHRIGKVALECAICINEFEDDDALRLLPKCDHAFHPECIDAWLASHTTCPVCRANLTPDEPAVEKVQIGTSLSPTNDLNARSERNEIQNEVSVCVDDRDEEVGTAPAPFLVPLPMATRKQNRRVTGRFPRSHSTGHSLVQLGKDSERFTLKLPEDVRRQILTLKRTTSCIVVLPREGSSRRGYRSSGEGSSRGKSYSDQFSGRSDRWVFTMTPPFLAKTGSVRSPKGNSVGAGDGTPRRFSTSVRTPFDCLVGRSDGVEQTSTPRPPV